jgi:hypothetical protein
MTLKHIEPDLVRSRCVSSKEVPWASVHPAGNWNCGRKSVSLAAQLALAVGFDFVPSTQPAELAEGQPLRPGSGAAVHPPDNRLAEARFRLSELVIAHPPSWVKGQCCLWAYVR